MESRFIVPVIVSTAFHALVFLLGNGSDTKVVGGGPTPSPAPGPDIVFTPIEEEPPPPPEPSDEVMPPLLGSPEIGPRLPDSAVEPPPGSFTFPPIAVPTNTTVIDHIPALPFGDRDGIKDGTAGPRIISSNLLDRPPRTRSQLAPDYPRDARSQGLTGEVLVQFVVDESGRVLNPRVVRSTDARFEASTLRAMERWRFEPGTKDGNPVRFRMVVPVVFNLD